MGLFPGKGTEQLKLYWAKGGTGLSWEYPWTSGTTHTPKLGELIGTQPVSVIQQGKDAIVTFNWAFTPNPTDYKAMFPSESGHFCLLARLQTSTAAPYGMTFPEGAQLAENVLGNNKIAMRNISIYGALLGDGGMMPGNFTKDAMNAHISFEILNADGKPLGLAGGKLILTAKGASLEKLKKSDYDRKFLKDIGNNQFAVLDPEKGIDNLVLAPGEVFPLSLTYKPAQKSEGYLIRVTQYAHEGTKLRQIGGQTFVYGKVKGYLTQAVEPHTFPCWLIILIGVILLIIIILCLRKYFK
jgi:hypothetical protein